MAEIAYAPNPRPDPPYTWVPSRNYDCTCAASSGGGGSGSGGLAGSGSPEGVITASPGQVYTDTSTGGFWNKVTGSGATGWQNLIA